jgi:flagellar protein FlgJ
MFPIDVAQMPIGPSGQSLESLAAQATSGDPRSAQRVAAEFEAIFASLVIKEMRQTLEPGSMFGQDSSDSYGGLFDMYLGRHLVQAGGFGVGRMVQRYLENRNDARG